MTNNLVPSPAVEMAHHANVPALLSRIRPEWQAKSLIIRVKNLLDVDPSSACQRLLNAAIHDLRGKIITAGIDIAAEAASQNKLPPVIKRENKTSLGTLQNNLVNLVGFFVPLGKGF